MKEIKLFFEVSMVLRQADVHWVAGVNDRASKEWMDCKVGASFSERVLISRDRVCLIDKKSYASIQGAEVFGGKLFLECVRQEVLRAKEVYFFADGANCVGSLKNNYFPEAIGVLDIRHLERELKKALGEDREAVVEALKELGLSGKRAEILQRLIKEGAGLRRRWRRGTT